MSYDQLQYQLICGNTTYSNESLNASLFRELIGELELYDFVVLEPSTPLENSIYMQAASLEEPESHKRGQMVVEIRFQQTKRKFRHYRLLTKNHDEILNLFMDYWGGQLVPNVEKWEDITDQF